MSSGASARHRFDTLNAGSAVGVRALLLNYEYPPIGGGAGVATAALARGLADRGAQVDVVTACSPGEDGEPRSSDRLTVHRVKSSRKSRHEATMANAGSYLLAAAPVIRRLLATHQYDVAHVFFSLPTGVLLPLIDWRGVPVVVSLRGSDVPGYDPTNRSLQCAHRVLRPLTRWIWRRADRVVALSDSLGRLALRTDPRLRYSVVHNGVDLTRFRPPATPRPAGAGALRCLAVARLVERKGLTDLLRAMARLDRDRFELDIAGSGPLEAALRQLTVELGLSSRVRFLGALDRDEVAEAYRRADLFTLASWEESFGNVFAEALASGLPIVGSDVGGIPEFIGHGTNGLLVPPRRPDALAQAIRYLEENRALRGQMRVRNRERAERTLSWDGVTSEYLEVYRALRVRPAAPTVLIPQPAIDW